MNDWKKESASEAKVIGTLVGATIGGGVLAARKISGMAEKSAVDALVKRCQRRDEIAAEIIAEAKGKLPRW